MIRWLLYLPFSLIVTVLCYITNPIVLLFADDDGELPSVLHLWQTWDNSCNPSDIVDIAPSWLQYDWAKHYNEYEGTTTYLRSVNRSRWFTSCVDDDFSLLDRIKRYICRVIWLTRNNAYGWSFYVLGLTISPHFEIDASDDEVYVSEVYGDGWMYKSTEDIFTLFGYTIGWNNLLGWKIDTNATVDTRAMIANRIAFKFTKEE